MRPLQRGRFLRKMPSILLFAAYVALAIVEVAVQPSRVPRIIRVSTPAQGLIAQLELRPPALRTSSQPLIEVSNVALLRLAAAPGVAPEQICIDSIAVLEQQPNQPEIRPTVHIVNAGYPVCLTSIYAATAPAGDTEVSYFILYSAETQSARLPDMPVGLSPSRWNPMLYPYDSFRLGIGVRIAYREVRDGIPSERALSNLIGTIEIPESPGWSVTAREQDTFGRYSPDGSFAKGAPVRIITFRRPLFDQVMFPIAVTCLALLVLLLLRLTNTNTFVEGVAAVFFGVFAFLQVLLPPATESRTIVHLAAWAIWAAVAGAVLYRLLCGEQPSATDIEVAAKRLPPMYTGVWPAKDKRAQRFPRPAAGPLVITGVAVAIAYRLLADKCKSVADRARHNRS